MTAAALAGFGALQGLKVLDLTQMLAGPYATMLLADQGADVIKIEPPGGDKTRHNGPYLPGALPFKEGGFGAYFGSVNRNKRSIVIDLKSEAGKQQLIRMVQQADVLVENFRTGVMEGLGLSYESLATHNPRLVYAALRGFGDPRSGETPYTHWPAYDPVAQAMVVALRRGPNDPEFSPFLHHRNHLHPALHRVQDAVGHQPQADWSVPQMAEVAHTSPRHLTRLFLEHAGIAPLQYLRRIRLATAEAALRSGQNVTQAALMAGFSSDTQLRRAWHQFGRGGTPSQGTGRARAH